LYATVDRPDNKTVRDLYASPEAARLAAPGQPLPDGTVLTMEVYKAKVDEKGEPAKDASGRMVRTPELVGIFVMEKQQGWGTEYPETLRNGEWEYARFTASGTLGAVLPCVRLTGGAGEAGTRKISSRWSW
jgi:hypothetical protein